jgi:hypothetical protein
MKHTFSIGLASLALLAPTGASAQAVRLKPAVELGVQLTAVPHDGAGWSALRPLMTINVTTRTAVDVAFDHEIDRSGVQTHDRLSGQVKRVLHGFERGGVFATLGVAVESRAFDYCRNPEFCVDRHFANPSGRQTNLGAHVGVGTEVAVSRRLSIRVDLQLLTGGDDDGWLRSSAGIMVPIGRYSDRAAWRANLETMRGGPLEHVQFRQRVWITNDTGDTIDGEVISRSATTLTVERRGEITAVPASSIRRIDTTDRIRDGIRLGAVIGGASGAVFGVIVGAGLCETTTDCIAYGGLYLGGVGAGLGAIAGAIVDSLRNGRRTISEAPGGRAF